MADRQHEPGHDDGDWKTEGPRGAAPDNARTLVALVVLIVLLVVAANVIVAGIA